MFINHPKMNIINYFPKIRPMLIHQHLSIPKYRVIRVSIQIIAVVIQISKSPVPCCRKQKTKHVNNPMNNISSSSSSVNRLKSLFIEYSTTNDRSINQQNIFFQEKKKKKIFYLLQSIFVHYFSSSRMKTHTSTKICLFFFF